MRVIMNKKSLKEREAHFLKRLKETHKDNYEYIGGYRGFDYPVKLKCNRCDRKIETYASYFLKGKNSYKCKCEYEIEDYTEFIKEKINELKNKDIEYISHTESEVLSEIKVKVRCKKCNSIYVYSYPRIRDGEVNCCNMENSMNYETYSNRLIKEIFPKGKPMTYENLNNYEEVIKKEMKYIMDGSRNLKFDKKELEKVLLVKAKELKEKWNVGECSICGDVKFGKGLNRLMVEYGDANICRSCSIEYVKCPSCGTTKKQNRFRFIKEEKTFSKVCIKCEEKKGLI